VRFDFIGANKTFFFPGTTINYNVFVSDKEDGSLSNKKIAANEVAISIDYLSEGYDLADIAKSQRSVDASVQNAGAIKLIGGSDCNACHKVNAPSLGPSFMAVAKKYKNDPAAQGRITKKIINGGSGVWGDAMMPGHSSLSVNDVNTITKYILSLDDAKVKQSKPVKGSYKVEVPKAQNSDKASFVFRAAYKDRGTKVAPQLSSEHMVILKSALVPVSQAQKTSGLKLNSEGSEAIISPGGGFFALENIDLTGIKTIDLITSGLGNGVGAEVELHTGSPDGRLISRTSELSGADNVRTATKVQMIVPATQGVHDYTLYLKTKQLATNPLLRISEVKFNNNKLP
jgi:cytochrome c